MSSKELNVIRGKRGATNGTCDAPKYFGRWRAERRKDQWYDVVEHRVNT